MKTNKTSKIKDEKYYENKSIIAGQLAAGCLCGFLTCGAVGLFASDFYYDQITGLNANKEEIYQQFMKSEEFDKAFKEEFIKLSDEYVNHKITFDEFESKVKHLQTVAYAQQLLANSNSDVQKDIVKIDVEIEAIKKKKNNNIITPIIQSGMALGMSGTIAGFGASLAHSYKRDAVEKKKKEEKGIKAL